MIVWRRKLLTALLPALLLSGLTFPLAAEETAEETADRRVTLTRWAGVGVITAWGLANWDYGEYALHATPEGWFDAHTREGGADKIGHLYSSYLLTRSFDGLYRHWGAKTPVAARDALISSLLLTGFIELGDGFSPYGVSWEDMTMNLAGGLIGYQLATHEGWQRRLDLRMEYVPSGNPDPLTDYQHARYLAALKLNGFAALERTPLQWLELHAGYYARGYDDPSAPDRRISYLGLGINFSALLARTGWRRTAKVLQFYQVPGTSLRADHEHDR